MVHEAIQWLADGGWTVSHADAEGYSTPFYIYHPDYDTRSRPDIIAWRDGVIAIVEVETPTSVRSSHSRSQIRIFSAAAHSRRGGFMLVVPESARWAAITAIQEEASSAVTLLTIALEVGAIPPPPSDRRMTSRSGYLRS
jgi:hypothetical protein